MSRWTVHAETTLYSSDWVSLHLADVELPNGRRLDHHLVRVPGSSVIVLLVDEAGRALMLYRHRFITDRWGWELPAGRMERGETPEQAAARETVEETGWRPGRLERLGMANPLAGLCDITHWFLLGCPEEMLGTPTDTSEAARLEWIPGHRALELIGAGEVPDGYSQHALLLAAARGRL